MQGFNMGRYIPPSSLDNNTPNPHTKRPPGSSSRGAQTVRFEMPFAIWCTTCKPHETIIGQGVRFNADKKKVGSYYSTPIFAFRMRHPPCGGVIEIRTDPARTEYVVTEGARRRDTGQSRDNEEGEGVLGLGLGEIALKLGARDTGTSSGGGSGDAFSKVEGKVEDKKRGDSERTRIEELIRVSGKHWEDPYEKSRRLRRGFRVERRGLEAKEREREALKEKLSLGIEVVDESEEDRLRAGMVDFEHDDGFSRGARVRPLFGRSGAGAKTDRAPAGGRESRKSRLKPQVPDYKALLRSELTGNTRAAVDPFLGLDGSSGWVPEAKRRKQSANAHKAGAAASAKRDASENASDSAAEPPAGGNRETQSGQKQTGPAALVDYDSD